MDGVCDHGGCLEIKGVRDYRQTPQDILRELCPRHALALGHTLDEAVAKPGFHKGNILDLSTTNGGQDGCMERPRHGPPLPGSANGGRKPPDFTPVNLSPAVDPPAPPASPLPPPPVPEALNPLPKENLMTNPKGKPARRVKCLEDGTIFPGGVKEVATRLKVSEGSVRSAIYQGFRLQGKSYRFLDAAGAVVPAAKPYQGRVKRQPTPAAEGIRFGGGVLAAPPSSPEASPPRPAPRVKPKPAPASPAEEPGIYASAAAALGKGMGIAALTPANIQLAALYLIDLRTTAAIAAEVLEGKRGVVIKNGLCRIAGEE